ncbi:MAG: taurine dioxygenase [Candidatus Poriferisodalaceae bacterium]|jgi:taurine dioxygenase
MRVTAQVRRLAGSLGAEITNIDLTKADPAHVLDLLMEHQVVFFPGQNLSVDDHISFGRQFGEIQGHPHLKNPFTENEFLLELAASAGGVAEEWHSDISFDEHPALYSILKMVECPPHGGDTMWASTYAAYESLSPAIQDMCDGLTALHDAHPHGRPDRSWIHPVVRVHPVTGRKSLFVNEHFTRRIVELSSTESEQILPVLLAAVARPQHTVRYLWTPGTIAIWDNRCTQHHVLNDFEGQRIIQRVTVMGDEVTGAGAPRWSPRVKVVRGDKVRLDRQLIAHLESREQKATNVS